MALDEIRKYELLDVDGDSGAVGVGIGTVLVDLPLDSDAILKRDVVGVSFRQCPDEMQCITPLF